jgi:hypothetical protein
MLIVWMAAGTGGSLDDKAVRYFHAARLYADKASIQAVRLATPSWLGRLDLDQRSRLHTRLGNLANSAIPDSLLRLMYAARLGKAAPASPGIPVTITDLLLFLFALGWLIAVTHGHPADMILVFACLLLAAAGLVPHALAPPSDPVMSYLNHAPRGSAMMLIMASFACFARGRGLLAGISLVLAAGWHAGLAAMTVPCALLSFGLTICDRAGSRYIQVMLAVLVVLGGLALRQIIPGPSLQPSIWIPAGFIILFLLAGQNISHPALLASASLGAFLFLTLAITASLSYPPFLDWLIKVTGDTRVGELPGRLTAARHLAAIALPLAALFGVLDRSLPGLLTERARRRALLTLATLGLAFACAAGRHQWPHAYRNLAACFHVETETTARTTPSPRNLASLDPRHEAAFFTALGDFLLTGPHPVPD